MEVGTSPLIGREKDWQKTYVVERQSAGGNSAEIIKKDDFLH